MLLTSLVFVWSVECEVEDQGGCTCSIENSMGNKKLKTGASPGEVVRCVNGTVAEFEF